MVLHPIIEDYVNTEDSPLVILERHLHADQKLEIAFILLFKSIGTDTVNKELELAIDEAIIVGHPDTNVYLFFIVGAMAYNNRLGQFDQSKSLYAIISSTLNKKNHPLIHALCMQAQAQIKRIDGNFVETKQLMRQSLTLVEQKCVRYNLLLRNYSVGLSAEGLLKDLSEYDQNILNHNSDEKQASDFFRIKLQNCIFIGDVSEAHRLIDAFKQQYPNSEKENIEACLNLLNILSGDYNEDNYLSNDIKILIREINAFISGNLEETLVHHQWIEKNMLRNHHSIINDYFPLHLEFALGNKGKAQLILKEKAMNTGHHYLDDLFYGRLQLLAKNFEEADHTFRRLIENVEHYGAMNRLIFELQFAKEMSLTDILRLSQGWKKLIKKDVIKKPTPQPPKLNAKGVNLLVGHSAAIAETKELIKKYAPLKPPVLITGETGTGKELVSRALHEEGAFSKEPFLAINCGALTDSLLQSELFGYVAGAFTGAQKERKGIFEAAGKGTVFLDEFGDISPKLQVSLLRVLEANEIRLLGGTNNRKIECRIIVATNTNLHQAVEAKKFREDLYFRLTRFEIKLPPLRERVEDLPELIQFFLDGNQEASPDNKTVSKELLTLLSAYQWPGNIRELKNEIDRLYILNPDKKILEKLDFDFSRLQGTHLQNDKTNPIENNSEPSKENNHWELMKEKGFVVEQRHTLIKELFLKHKKLTRNQIMAVTKVSPSTATKDLKILCEAGIIIKKSPTKSPRTDYFEISGNRD